MRPAVLPIYQSSTFSFETAEQGERAFEIAYGLDKPKQNEELPLIYTRVGNPNIELLEEKIVKWDQAEASVVFPSGMSAISSLCLCFLKPGDRFLTSDPIYGGAEHLFHVVLKKFGIECDSFPAGASKEEILEHLNKHAYKMVYLETPCNPLVKTTSLGSVKEAILESNQDLMFVVDNTFAGPVFQQPLKHGADIVLYSMTKFFGGHSDVTAGCCMGKSSLIETLRGYRCITGAIPSPNTCWLLCRSCETLELRMKQQCEHTKYIVKGLRRCVGKEILNIHYPESSEELLDTGSLFAFEVGTKEKAFRILNKVKVWLLAVSLGGVESLIEHPSSMTHSCMTPEQKKKAGLTPGLIRCSVGLESPEELLKDLLDAIRTSD